MTGSFWGRIPKLTVHQTLTASVMLIWMASTHHPSDIDSFDDVNLDGHHLDDQLLNLQLVICQANVAFVFKPHCKDKQKGQFENLP